MTHGCGRCWLLQSDLANLKHDLKGAVGNIENQTRLARSYAARIPAIKALIEEKQRQLDEHLAEFDTEPEQQPRRILDVRRPKAKPAPKQRPNRTVIDRDALAAVLAAPVTIPPERGYGTNTLPATGHCHTCDKAVTGDRRYCGRCLAGRI